MPQNKILISNTNKETAYFIEEYFSDTKSIIYKASQVTELEIALKNSPTYIFCGAITDSLITYASKKSVNIFLISSRSVDNIPNDGILVIPEPLRLDTLNSAIFSKSTFPETIKILVVDDEREIGLGLKDFLELRNNPCFAVDIALNGLEGFDMIERFAPDVIVLDLKMPLKNGQDLYKEVIRKYPEKRIIVLTATVAADELIDLKKYSNPTIVEKGSHASSLPQLLTLIKKKYIFS